MGSTVPRFVSFKGHDQRARPTSHGNIPGKKRWPRTAAVRLSGSYALVCRTLGRGHPQTEGENTWRPFWGEEGGRFDRFQILDDPVRINQIAIRDSGATACSCGTPARGVPIRLLIRTSHQIQKEQEASLGSFRETCKPPPSPRFLPGIPLHGTKKTTVASVACCLRVPPPTSNPMLARTAEEASLQNEQARVRVDSLNTEAHNLQLRETMRRSEEELNSKDRLIEKYQNEIRQRSDEIEKKVGVGWGA